MVFKSNQSQTMRDRRKLATGFDPVLAKTVDKDAPDTGNERCAACEEHPVNRR